MKQFSIYSVFLLIITSLLISSCDSATDPTPPTVDTKGFETEGVAKVFAENCAVSGCHVGSSAPNGLAIDSHANLIKGSTARTTSGGADVIIPFRSDKSLLYHLIQGNATPRMPFQKNPLSDADITTVKEWIDNGAKDDKGVVPFSTPSYRVFVCSQAADVVTVIDGDQKVVSRVIDVDFNQTVDSPHMVKEHGDFYYVTMIAAGKFLKIKKSDNTIAGEVNGLEIPGMIQLIPSQSKAYVSRSSSGTGDYNGIYVIDIANMTILKEIPLVVGGVPHGIALSPDNSKLYIANLTKDRLHIVNTTTDELEESISLDPGTEPMQTASSPDGNYLYISARGTAKLIVWDTNSKSVVAQIDSKPMPMHIVTNSSGDKIYVNSMGASVVQVFTKAGMSWSKTKEITSPGFSMLHGLDITGDDRFLYVSSRNVSGMYQPKYAVTGAGNVGTVGIIDTQTETVVKVLDISPYGAGLTVEK